MQFFHFYFTLKRLGWILNPWPGNTKWGSITVLLTSCLTGLASSVLQIKTKIVSSHTADSKPVKQEVNGRVILPPLVFPALTSGWWWPLVISIITVSYFSLRLSSNSWPRYDEARDLLLCYCNWTFSKIVFM